MESEETEPVSGARVLYVTDSTVTDDAPARLDARLPGARVVAVDPETGPTAVADRDRPVDTVVYAPPLSEDADDPLPAFVRERVGDVPVVLFADRDGGRFGPGIEYVQRKNAASVAVLAETLRERLGLDADTVTDESGTTTREPPLDAVVKAAGDPILTVDDRSVVRFANPAVEETFGYEPSELVGEPLTTLMNGETAERHLDAVERYLRTGERTLDWDSVRVRAKHREGHEFPIEVSFAEFTDGDGDHYFTGIVRDVGERERRTNELRRYETMIDTVADGIYALDGDDRFVAVNDAYLEMTGYEREELIGAPAATVTGPALATDVQRVRSSLTDESSSVTLRTDLPIRDGEPVPIEARITRFPIGNGDGEYGRVGVVRDMSERERLESELNRVLDRVTDAFFGLNRDWEFTYVNESAEKLLERTESELLGELVWNEFPEAEGSMFQRQYERAMETQEPVSFEEYYPPLDAWFEVNAYPSETGLSVYFRDVTETRRRMEHLTALNERFDRFAEAESCREVADIVVAAATEALGLSCCYVALYDESEGELRRTAESEAASSLVDSVLLTEDRESPVWTAYIRGETRVVDDFGAEFDGESPLEGVAAFALGSHGVFVAASPEGEDAIDESDVLLAGMLASTAESSLDRATREADLRANRDRLADKNDRLTRLYRVNRATRDITGALLQADSHEAIEELVCERLVDIEPYAFAWIGHADLSVGEIGPSASAGDGGDYLDRIELPLDDSEQLGPAAQAVETGEPQVQNDLMTAESFDPWREEALSQGFRAAITIPIQYRETLHGVLALYADQPGVFNDMETAALAELGETIGYAMNAIDRKQALVGEQSTELEFSVSTEDEPLFGFLGQSEGRFLLENAIHRMDGRINLFFTTEGVGGEAIRKAALDSPTVEQVRIVSEDEGDESGCLFVCTITGEGFVSDLLERGALLESIDVAGSRATFVIRVPWTADARGFVEYFQEEFGGTTLLARRERDEPVMTPQEFENEVRARLTERQEEVIRTAYFAGFFEWPRRSNGQEVAELLGVTQPTVNRHIRAGEHTVFGLLFDDD
jgi:PAS domain S-box-containing protein